MSSLSGDALEIARKLSGTSLSKYCAAINTKEGTYAVFEADKLVIAFLQYLIDKKNAANYFHHALKSNHETESTPINPKFTLSTENLKTQLDKAGAIAREFWVSQSAASALRATEAKDNAASLRSLLKAMVNTEDKLIELLAYLAENAKKRVTPYPTQISTAPKKSTAASSVETKAMIDNLVQAIPASVGSFPTFASEAKGAVLDGWGAIKAPGSERAIGGKDKARLYMYVYVIDQTSVYPYGSVDTTGKFLEGSLPIFHSQEEHMKKYGQSPALFKEVKGATNAPAIVDFLNKVNDLTNKTLKRADWLSYTNMYQMPKEEGKHKPTSSRPRSELSAISHLAQTLLAAAKTKDPEANSIPVAILENTFNRSSPFTSVALPIIAHLARISRQATSSKEPSSTKSLFDDILEDEEEDKEETSAGEKNEKNDDEKQNEKKAVEAKPTPADDEAAPKDLRQRLREKRASASSPKDDNGTPAKQTASASSAIQPRRTSTAVAAPSIMSMRCWLQSIGVIGFLVLVVCVCSIAMVKSYKIILAEFGEDPDSSLR